MPHSLVASVTNKGGATQVTVYRNNNGSFTAMGNPFTPTNLLGDAATVGRQNMVVQFGQYFYCSAGDDLRVFNPSTGNWDSQVAAYCVAGYSGHINVGIGPTGAPRMVVICRLGGDDVLYYMDTPGGAWSGPVVLGSQITNSSFYPNAGSTKIGNEVLFKARGYVRSYDIASGSTSTQSITATTTGIRGFARYRDRVFLNASSGFGNSSFFWERLAGTWTEVIDFALTNTVPYNGTQFPENGVMLYDGVEDAIIMFMYSQTSAAAPANQGLLPGDATTGGTGLHAIKIPISMISSPRVGPDAGTGFDFAATTITRNDGGSWVADQFTIGDYVQVLTATTGANIVNVGPVTGVTSNVLTIASATFTPDTGDNTAKFDIMPQIITGLVVPLGLQPPSGPAPSGDIHMRLEVDTDTDPTSPTFYIWLLINDGTWQRYQYNGANALLTALGSGGDRSLALTSNPDGGGEFFYNGSTTAAPALHIEEVAARIPLVEGMRITVKGYLIDETGGAPSTVDKAVGLYYGVTGPTPKNLGTITNVQKVSGPGSAPSLAANKMTMTFDNTSIYTFDWLAGAGGDGLADQERHQAMPHVTV